MKKIIYILLFLPITGLSQTIDIAELNGPYFGQKPPEMTPEIFAPELLVKEIQAHSSIVFSKEGTEAYWCYNGIWFSKLDKNNWTIPTKLPFSKAEYSDDAPFLSPDGKHLFFTSKRPAEESDTSGKENIWMVDLINNGWSDPVILPPVVNEMFQHWQVSVDLYGNLYFGHRPDEEGNKDIYSSKYVNGEYQKPQKLGGMINSEVNEINPYISPGGNYLIFARIKEGKPLNGGLFISYHLDKDNWSEAKPLQQYFDLNFGGNCAIITQDGKYLFYLGGFNGGWERYWVSAKFIEELKKRF